MINYELIIAFAFTGALIQEVPLWNTILDKLGLDMKPFNCPLCLTFWLTLGPFYITDGAWFIFNSIIASVLAELINRQMNKS